MRTVEAWSVENFKYYYYLLIIRYHKMIQKTITTSYQPTRKDDE